jgi:hypothetical protein
MYNTDNNYKNRPIHPSKFSSFGNIYLTLPKGNYFYEIQRICREIQGLLFGRWIDVLIVYLDDSNNVYFF